MLYAYNQMDYRGKLIGKVDVYNLSEAVNM